MQHRGKLIFVAWKLLCIFVKQWVQWVGQIIHCAIVEATDGDSVATAWDKHIGYVHQLTMTFAVKRGIGPV